MEHKFGRGFEPLTKDYINPIGVQTARFLPSVRAIANKGISAGTVSQPADQVITTGYVILDTPTILHARTLANIPSLMTRIQIADYQREKKVQHLETIDSVAVAEANAETHALFFTKEEVARGCCRTCRLVQMVIATLVLFNVVADDAAVQAAGVQ